MRILFLGDLVGRPARQAALALLPRLREELKLDGVVANVENIAHGAGVTTPLLKQLKNGGVDLMTLGNHLWAQRDFLKDLDSLPFLCFPANLLPSSSRCFPNFLTLKTENGTLGVVSLMGLDTAHFPILPPFPQIESILESLQARCDRLLVDFHAERSAEKVALGWFLDGRVSAVVGTHTHVQTNDARRLPGGTLFISDVGMCGALDGVIGAAIGGSLNYFLHGQPRKKEMATKNVHLCGVVLDFALGQILPFQLPYKPETAH